MGSLEPEEILVIILLRESRLLCLGKVSEPGEVKFAPQVELPRRRVLGVDAELIERFDGALRVVFPQVDVEFARGLALGRVQIFLACRLGMVGILRGEKAIRI